MVTLHYQAQEVEKLKVPKRTVQDYDEIESNKSIYLKLGEIVDMLNEYPSVIRYRFERILSIFNCVEINLPQNPY